MMTGKDPQKNNKFYFHLHNFDDDYEEDEQPEEDLPPPPPTFSEDELEAAKKAAFDDGKREGLQESLSKTETLTADVLEQIKGSFSSLLDDEMRRQHRFEKEAVEAALAMFEKVFPLYSEKFGLMELEAKISEVLQKMSNTDVISVFVNPTLLEPIKNHIEGFSEARVQVLSDETIPEKAVRMEWNHGGAYQDLEHLAKEVRDTVNQLLEERAAKRHDDNNKAAELISEQEIKHDE